MLFFFSMLFSFILFSFSIYSSPVYFSILLFCSSVFVVLFLTIYLSSWYSYLLFLVYVGGLLVLFMYLCLMSSNEMLKKVFPNVFLVVLVVLLMNFLNISDINPNFLGYSNYESSYFLEMSVLLSLMVILLFTLFIIVLEMSVLLSLMVILLFTLFIIVRLVNLKKSLIV
uniref:NADH dehydrogenase subunit 6 n=1 Tax=Gyraulus sp. GE1 TaxID=2880038 RepID=A0A976LZV6_9GAST|nr:NADH dehydrogenase subunit 6 [Gyraulus sp. GE1]